MSDQEGAVINIYDWGKESLGREIIVDPDQSVPTRGFKAERAKGVIRN